MAANVEQTFDQGGIILPGQIAAEQTNNIVYYVQQYFTNFFPLMSRVTRIPEKFQTFKVRHWKYRPRKFNFTSAFNTSDQYTLVTLPATQQVIGHEIGDETALMQGDVLEFIGTNGTAERVEVLATSTSEVAALPALPAAANALVNNQFKTVPGQVLVKRGVDSTTPQAIAAPASGSAPNYFVLMGNSRTGGEVFQSGIRATPLEVDNQCQNFMAPVQVSGSAQTSEIVGVPNLMEQIKQQQLFNIMRDMESACWFGNGEAVGVNNRPKTVGIRAQTNVNFISPSNPDSTMQPTTPGMYTPQNFTNDVLLRLYNFSAPPNVMFCSPAFLAGLDMWGQKAIRIQAGKTELGIEVEAYNSTIAPGVAIIPAPILGGVPGQNLYRAWIGRFENLLYHQKRGEYFQMRGVRGDAMEGDWIAEGGIENRDAEKSVWLEGITAFGPPY